MYIPDLSFYINKVDIIFALGDFTSIEVLNYLKSFKKSVFAVYGNVDDSSVKAYLPETLIVNVNNLKIGLYHGRGMPIGIEKRVESAFSENLNAYIFGHTHMPVNKFINEKLFFNPGTASGIKSTIGILYIDFNNIWGEILRLSSHVVGI